MLENLFIPDDPTSICSSEVELSEDLNSWPLEIQSAIISSVPLLGEVQGQLYMDALDKDKMYAKGSYVVKTPDDDIVIPVIVKAKQMSPTDLFIYKGKWYPMDMETLSAILTSAQIGTDLVADEDIPPTATNRMPTNIMPPGSHGTGTGMISSVANKMSSLNPKMTEQIVSAIQGTPGVIKKLAHNKVAREAIVKTLETPYVEKRAAVNPFKETDSVIVSLGKGRFSVKYADAIATEASEIVLEGNELAQGLKEAGLDCGRIVKDLLVNKVATSWDDSQEPSKGIAEGISLVKTAGMYKFYPRHDVGHIKQGYAVATVKDSLKDQMLVILGDDSYALQDKVAGVKTASEYSKDFMGKFVKLASNIQSGDTIAVPVPDNSSEDAPVTSMPLFKVSSVNHQKNATVINGTTDFGKTAFILTGEPFECPVKAKIIPEDIMVSKSASAWYLPNDYIVYSLPNKKVELVNSAEDFRSSYALNKMASNKSSKLATAKIWKTSPSTYAVKMAGKEPAIRSEAEVMLLLRKGEGSGVMNSLVKLASGMVKIIDMVAPMKYGLKEGAELNTKRAAAIKSPKIASTIKVAAIMEDEEDINTVLSLNYITPENLSEFKAAVPQMRETEETLAKLLMSTRLGNNIVNEEDVKDTLVSLHSITKELDSTL